MSDYTFFYVLGRQFGWRWNAPFRIFYWHNTPNWRRAGGIRIFTFELAW